MQAPNRLYKSDLRGSVSRVKTPCEQGLHHCTYVRATSRSTPSSCDGEGEAPFLHGTWTLRLGHPAWNPQCTHSLGDVGETRWLLSHRWTDTSPILLDVAHDSRNQGRVVSLSVLSLLSACVRLCQLREVHHSLQQALNPKRSYRRVTCLLHIISNVTRVRHAQGTTVSIFGAFICLRCC